MGGEIIPLNLRHVFLPRFLWFNNFQFLVIYINILDGSYTANPNPENTGARCFGRKSTEYRQG